MAETPLLCGCCSHRSQQLSSKPEIHLQGAGSCKAHMVLSSHPRVLEGSAWWLCTKRICPWVQELGRTCQPPPACICPSQGYHVTTGQGNGLGTSHARGTATFVQLNPPPQSRAATSRPAGQPSLLPASCLLAAGIQKYLLTCDKAKCQNLGLSILITPLCHFITAALFCCCFNGVLDHYYYY